MTLLLQISDTHFGTERPEVVTALQRIAMKLAPDVLMLSGDITQRAHRAQFAAAAKVFAALPATLRIAIPGNHDIPLFNPLARIFWPYRNYAREFGERESLQQLGDITILALDATYPARHKDGHLPPEHLERQLALARSKAGESGLLVVAAHQPLYTAWVKDHRQTLLDRGESAALLSKYRADVVLSGHVHVPLISTTHKPFPELSWPFVLCGSGTTVSHRTRPGAPNSFNTLNLGGGAEPVMTICRYDFAGNEFTHAEEQQFHRAAQGWSAV